MVTSCFFLFELTFNKIGTHFLHQLYDGLLIGLSSRLLKKGAFFLGKRMPVTEINNKV
ncbi:hypothetical protein JOC75_002197 [Metabacillus crassostreae]|nr:hypothetical protein [Metabacillus crassostreae]